MRRGVSVAGSTAYVSHFPSVNCAKMLAAAVFRTLNYHFDYSNGPGVLDLLAEAGVRVIRF